MSYNFYSLVSSIKDKSSQAMATLSSDLKEFTAIVQEDAAEVAKTLRKTVQEKSEQLRQQAEQDAADDNDDTATVNNAEANQMKQTDGTPAGTIHDAAEDETSGKTQPSTSASLFSFSGLSLEGLSLQTMGSKLLNSADEFLGALAGDAPLLDEDEDDDEKEKQLAARRFRLLALQEDSDTYIEPPMDTETFHKWQTTTSPEVIETIKAEVLEHYPTVGAKFMELVPSVVESETFWAHYIYKASLLAAQEQRGADLLEHALNDDEEEISWDADSPKNDTTTKTERGDSFFPEEESKEEEKVATAGGATTSKPVVEPIISTPATMAPVPPMSSKSVSSDASWIELDERKDQQQSPLLSPLEPMDEVNVSPLPAQHNGADDEDEVDWGDDDVVPEAKTESSASLHEDKKERGGDWGEWD